VTFVIAAPCVADYSCVEVCPVNCIGPGPQDPEFQRAEQLYINPQQCIGCGACLEVCPVAAVYSMDSLPAKWQHYAAVNRSYFIHRSSAGGRS
jgi:formate hydrogenlyase subunit 6/NADH:ubiquinone oxidoreductase subunit I